jgi:ubiquinone/menaquinone biosynthesis C-methylase UbiE
MSGSKSERDVRRFNRWSRTYEDSWAQGFFTFVHKRMLALVDVEQPDTVVDVGCGTGRLLRRVGERWPSADLIGVDPAEGMLEVARRKTSRATFHLTGAESLPLPSNSADLVLSSISFHHWPDQAAGLREIARVLRPGGQLCLSDPVMPARLSRAFRSYAKSPGALRGLIVDAGLRVKTQRTIIPGFVFATIGSKP